MSNQYQMGKVEWLMLLTLSILWGSSFVNLKISLSEIEPFTVVLIRVAIAFLGLLAWCIYRKKSFKMSLKDHLLIFGLGMVLTAIPFSFFTFGQKFVSTSIASVFNGTVPFFTAIFAHLWLGQSERLTSNKVIGLIIGLFGILTIVGIDAVNNFDLSNVGQIAIIIACLFYALSGIYTRLFVNPELDNTMVATMSLFWSTIVMFIIAAYFEGFPTLDYSGQVWFSITMLALLSTAVTYVILFRLLKRAGASNTSLTTFIIPFFSIALGTLLMGETIEMNEIMGFVLILIGLGFIQNFKRTLQKMLA